MPITHAVIAYQQDILVEVGNNSQVAHRVINLVPTNTSIRKSYSYDEQVYHVWGSENGLVALCASDKSLSLKVCFGFLQDIRTRFLDAYPQFQYSPPQTFVEFSRILKDRMQFFSTDSSVDTMKQASKQINQLQDVMKENIEKVLEREEKIEILLENTDGLQEEATGFKQAGKQVQKTMYWRDKKRNCCLIVCCIIVSVVIVAILVVGILIGIKVIPLAAFS